MDRRLHERFDLEASASFSWKDEGGIRWRGRGLTRDISETGVFIVAADVPPSGSPVRLEVHAYSEAGPGLLMQTKGKVVRVEAVGAKTQVAIGTGFAVVTNSLVLRNCKPATTGRDRGSKVSSGVVSRALSSYSRKPN
jgi:hypothetical protein